MFRPDRDRLLSQVVWNGDRGGHADKKDLSYYVDCCKYAGVDKVRDDENWRAGWISDDAGNGRLKGLGHERIAQWLRQEVS